ncbi:hypothetical protein ACEYYA_04925 [Paracoccus sp. p3-h83]|uniref:hypothetical protein n=1 Tax=Paracoccus sp. p3-h83 TaxID=3342805 RepID=UPI0035BB565F
MTAEAETIIAAAQHNTLLRLNGTPAMLQHGLPHLIQPTSRQTQQHRTSQPR